MRFFLALMLAFLGIACAQKNPHAPNPTSQSGKAIYELKCKACHGENGNLGAAGAKNLITSQASAEEVKKMIVQGKGAMPPMGHDLTNVELDSLVQFVLHLKK